MSSAALTLIELASGRSALVTAIAEHTAADPTARRLRELGFVPGERVRLITAGPFGGDPLLVQVGYTRFALRRAEAARVAVSEVGDDE